MAVQTDTRGRACLHAEFPVQGFGVAVLRCYYCGDTQYGNWKTETVATKCDADDSSPACDMEGAEDIECTFAGACVRCS